MPRVMVDGQEYEIPADMTGQALKRRAGVDAEAVIYRVGRGGEGPSTLDDDKPVRLQDGDQVGQVRPFISGG